MDQIFSNLSNFSVLDGIMVVKRLRIDSERVRSIMLQIVGISSTKKYKKLKFVNPRIQGTRKMRYEPLC